jgi:hypothetical protein
MPQSQVKRVAYLFGAGATNAELSHVGVDIDEDGLLISDVTKRVTIEAKRDPEFLKHSRMFLERAANSSNIELFISLIENNESDIDGASVIVDRLKDMVENDIRGILTPDRLTSFSLHKALFELHDRDIKETLVGLISLNYDTVLDDAYTIFYREPDYCFSFPTSKSEKPPLLKLHGSFNWEGIEINQRKRRIPIIPIGIDKDYLRLPYNFIWGRALEVLAGCDTLRVVGCSLSQNDIPLIDLLFKAHLEKGTAFEIEVISSEETGQEIKSRYDFFPRITTAEKIEDTLMSDVKRSTNVFKEWLKAKGSKLLKTDEDIRGTAYLKDIIL